MILATSDISHFWGAARNQATRPTCLAFVVSDMNAALNSITQDLSVEYLCHHAAKCIPDWSGEGFTTEVMFDAVDREGQPHEVNYPYSPHDHHAPFKVPPSDFSPIYYSEFETINCKASDLETIFLDHEIVGIAIAVSQSLLQPIDGLIAYDPFAIEDAYHALILAGLGKHKETNERYFLVRNSWGTDWGINGYAWLPQSLLDLHLVETFTLNQNGKNI